MTPQDENRLLIFSAMLAKQVEPFGPAVQIFPRDSGFSRYQRSLRSIDLIEGPVMLGLVEERISMEVVVRLVLILRGEVP